MKRASEAQNAVVMQRLEPAASTRRLGQEYNPRKINPCKMKKSRMSVCTTTAKWVTRRQRKSVYVDLCSLFLVLPPTGLDSLFEARLRYP